MIRGVVVALALAVAAVSGAAVSPLLRGAAVAVTAEAPGNAVTVPTWSEMATEVFPGPFVGWGGGVL